MGLRPPASISSDPQPSLKHFSSRTEKFSFQFSLLIRAQESGLSVHPVPSTTPESQLTLNLLRGQRAALDSVRSTCRPSTEPNSRASNSGILCSVAACDSGSTGGPGKTIAGRGWLPNLHFLQLPLEATNPASLVPQPGFQRQLYLCIMVFDIIKEDCGGAPLQKPFNLENVHAHTRARAHSHTHSQASPTMNTTAMRDAHMGVGKAL